MAKRFEAYPAPQVSVDSTPTLVEVPLVRLRWWERKKVHFGGLQISMTRFAVIIAIMSAFGALVITMITRVAISHPTAKVVSATEGQLEFDSAVNVKLDPAEALRRHNAAIEAGRRVMERIEKERGKQMVNPSMVLGGVLAGSIQAKESINQLLVDNDGYVWGIGRTCYKIDPLTMKIVGTFSLGGQPSEAIIVGSTLWCANNQGLIYVQGIDTRTLESNAGFVVSQNGNQSVLAGDTRHIWVAVTELIRKQPVTRIARFMPNGEPKGELKIYGQAVNGLGLDKAGNAWASCPDQPINQLSSKVRSTILVINGNDRRLKVTRAISSDSMASITGLKMTSDGNAWVICRSGGEVVELNADGVEIGRVKDVHGTSHVYEVANQLWLDNQSGNLQAGFLVSYIHRVDRLSHTVAETIPAKGYITTMAVDAKQRLWVVDNCTDRITANTTAPSK